MIKPSIVFDKNLPSKKIKKLIEKKIKKLPNKKIKPYNCNWRRWFYASNPKKNA